MPRILVALLALTCACAPDAPEPEPHDAGPGEVPDAGEPSDAGSLPDAGDSSDAGARLPGGRDDDCTDALPCLATLECIAGTCRDPGAVEGVVIGSLRGRPFHVRAICSSTTFLQDRSDAYVLLNAPADEELRGVTRVSFGQVVATSSTEPYGHPAAGGTIAPFAYSPFATVVTVDSEGQAHALADAYGPPFSESAVSGSWSIDFSSHVLSFDVESALVDVEGTLDPAQFGLESWPACPSFVW